MDFKPLKDFMHHLTDWVIPGNACVVYKDGKRVFEYSTGYSDLENKIPMTGDELSDGKMYVTENIFKPLDMKTLCYHTNKKIAPQYECKEQSCDVLFTSYVKSTGDLLSAKTNQSII